jgi:hypothetical protein
VGKSADNVQKLYEAGVITVSPMSLPDEYREVVNGLDDDAVKLLISLTRDLKIAERKMSVAECFIPL